MIDYSNIDYDNPEEVDEAIETLEKLRADKRLMAIYEYRESALHDYVDGMNSAEKRGIAIGEERGIAKGRAEEREKMISQMRSLGYSEDQIRELLEKLK